MLVSYISFCFCLPKNHPVRSQGGVNIDLPIFAISWSSSVHVPFRIQTKVKMLIWRRSVDELYIVSESESFPKKVFSQQAHESCFLTGPRVVLLSLKAAHSAAFS